MVFPGGLKQGQGEAGPCMPKMGPYLLCSGCLGIWGFAALPWSAGYAVECNVMDPIVELAPGYVRESLQQNPREHFLCYYKLHSSTFCRVIPTPSLIPSRIRSGDPSGGSTPARLTSSPLVPTPRPLCSPPPPHHAMLQVRALSTRAGRQAERDASLSMLPPLPASGGPL